MFYIVRRTVRSFMAHRNPGQIGAIRSYSINDRPVPSNMRDTINHTAFDFNI